LDRRIYPLTWENLVKSLDVQLWEHMSNAAKAILQNKVEAVGKPAGTLVMDPAKASALLNDGFTFVACGSDYRLVGAWCG